MIGFVFFGVMFFAVFTPFFMGAFFGISCLYEYTIKLVYEYGYNKNREDKRHLNISDYEDYAVLSVLTLFPYLAILLHISAIFWNNIVVTMPMTLTVFTVWMVINYFAFYKIGCRDGNKEMAV